MRARTRVCVYYRKEVDVTVMKITKKFLQQEQDQKKLTDLNNIKIPYDVRNRRLKVTHPERLPTFRWPGQEIRASLEDPLEVRDRQEEVQLQEIEADLRQQLYSYELEHGLNLHADDYCEFDPADLSYKYDPRKFRFVRIPEGYWTTIDMAKMPPIKDPGKNKERVWPDLIITTSDPFMWSRLLHVLKPSDEGGPIAGAKLLDVKFTADREYVIFAKISMPFKLYGYMFWQRPTAFEPYNLERYDNRYTKMGDLRRAVAKQYNEGYKILMNDPRFQEQLKELKEATQGQIEEAKKATQEEYYEFNEKRKAYIAQQKAERAAKLGKLLTPVDQKDKEAPKEPDPFYAQQKRSDQEPEQNEYSNLTKEDLAKMDINNIDPAAFNRGRKK